MCKKLKWTALVDCAGIHTQKAHSLGTFSSLIFCYLFMHIFVSLGPDLGYTLFSECEEFVGRMYLNECTPFRYVSLSLSS